MKTARDMAQDALLWLAVIVLVLVLTGCTGYRFVWMNGQTSPDETYHPCLDTTVVCIKE